MTPHAQQLMCASLPKRWHHLVVSSGCAAMAAAMGSWDLGILVGSSSPQEALRNQVSAFKTGSWGAVLSYASGDRSLTTKNSKQ
mmetsp:Transcript_25793/g.38379  ORF Transcript_25793/g.38379 Transcript_25793/m.38379 type:complete len:84 (-) Transcript_25793:200-451(-)